jgi:protein-serine/threonine kinase
MPVPCTLDASQTDTEASEASDIPPHLNLSTPSSNAPTPSLNGTSLPHPTNGGTPITNSLTIPLPPPEAGTFIKEPGHTRHSLHQLVLSNSNGTLVPELKHEELCPRPCQIMTPSTASSPSASESEWSGPPTRPSSQAPSRAGSMSEEKKPPAPTSSPKAPAATAKQEKEPSSPKGPLRAKSPSVSSDKGDHKFTLKDLLASGPKLARKPSQRSTGSSKKSDSDGDRKSTAGDSVGSLSKKYGVCQKVAIGKGATSVVRLAHKWDRSEEKLYAVKVRVSMFSTPVG